MGKFYITTAIAYVNAPPHIGHALEFILTDALARYRRLLGDEVYFLTGTDENSLNAVQAAEREGVDVRELVDRNAVRFIALKEALGLSYDDFIRTTEKRHFDGAQKLWRACRPEDIYKRSYRGLYCVGCEAFYTEEELVEGLCPEHKVRPEMVEEENYFFRLSAYQQELLDLIKSDRLRIVPATRRNEVLSFVEAGLEDFSVSRSTKRARGWGVPVPGDPSQIMYVWFDALSNYITALGYAYDDTLFRRMWQENPETVHVIGKGIIRFHAVYWPAMLLSAGLRPPRTIFVHGYVTRGGEKMSKTLGNVVDPFELVSRYGTDAVRYYFLREVSSTEDGDFTYEKLEMRYTADLANGLGNLVSRTLSMVERYNQGLVRRAGNPDGVLARAAREAVRDYRAAFERFELHQATAAVWKLVDAANLYAQESRPWDLSRDPARRNELDAVLYQLCEALRIVSILLQPIIPETARRIRQQLGLQESEPLGAAEPGRFPEGTRAHKGEILFPRLG